MEHRPALARIRAEFRAQFAAVPSVRAVFLGIAHIGDRRRTTWNILCCARRVLICHGTATSEPRPVGGCRIARD